MCQVEAAPGRQLWVWVLEQISIRSLKKAEFNLPLASRVAEKKKILGVTPEMDLAVVKALLHP